MDEPPLLADGQHAGAELRTPDAWLRRQRLEDAEADYEAVMASRDALRVWCDGTWPEDGFTLEENRDDLAGHIADAEAGTAFGYTIWDTEGERVLGSLYLEAVAPFLDAYVLDEATRAEIAACDVRVECWLRSGLPAGVELRILSQIDAWLTQAWPFARPCWGSRRGMTARRDQLESLGLVELAVLRSADGERVFHLHARRRD